MNQSTPIHPMPKEISGLNTYWVIQYLRKNHPGINLQNLLDEITNNSPCFVENLQTGELEQVTLVHMQIPRYWYSHEFVRAFYGSIQNTIPDPKLGYKMGRTLYRSQSILQTAIGIPLLGLHRVAHKVSREAAKFNRTKIYTVEKESKGFVIIRLTHNPGVVINDFTMQWNAGCFASYAKLAGAMDIDINIVCVDRGPKTPEDNEQAIWDFEIKYKEPSLKYRLTKAIIYNLPWIREITDRAERIDNEHMEQILHRDKIIKEHTDKLLKIQERLINQEREIIENRLQDISLELISTEERERRIIAQDLHDSVTQLLAVSLMKVRSMETADDPKSSLKEVENYLTQSLEELRSLTFQISPPVLYDFGLEAAVNWLIEDVNKRHDMKLKLSNLPANSLQLDQEYTILLYRTIRELVINIIKHSQSNIGAVSLDKNNDLLTIIVEDHGRGFNYSSIKQGFGLSSLQKRIENLRGAFRIETQTGSGTKITIEMPV